MTPSGILETVIYVSDLDAAEAFYGYVLGLACVGKQNGRQVFFRCGNQMLLIFNPQATLKKPQKDTVLPVPPHGSKGPGHVCFRASASEIDTWRSRLKGHDIAIEADFQWPGGGRSIYFRDPDGNSLEFAEPRIWDLTQ